MFRHWRLKRRCRVLAAACRQASMGSYIKACAGLQPDKLINTPLISVDLELTGLDARQNQIIAIGWTQVDEGRIRFGSNQHIMVNARQSVGHSASIHEMMDNEVARGVALKIAMQALFEAAHGRVWLFHHAALDVAFLQQACLSWAGVIPPFVVLDTLQIELQMRKRRNLPVQQGELQLTSLRHTYNLPRYTAHNALIDACATAELMLAIASRMDLAHSLDLRSHLNYY